ncbi:camp-dependent protein kinase regulatory subunit, partial [Auriculariales sp. MPI-PUGE-AT-0066]
MDRYTFRTASPGRVAQLSHRPFATMSTFDALVEDLSRDFRRVQPKDALQYCASWFQHRLEEQRTLIRDKLDRTSLPPEVPLHVLQDQTSSNYPSFSSTTRGSMPNSQSPFGTLNVPGNALLQSTPPSSFPAFSFHHDASPFGTVGGGVSALGNPADPTDLLQPPPSALGRRVSVSAESIEVTASSDQAIPSQHKSAEQAARIRSAISKHFLFKNLSDKQVATVVGAMAEVRVPAHELIIRQGDDGDVAYVVETGTFYCYKKPESQLPPGSPFTNGFSNNNSIPKPPSSWTWNAEMRLHPELGDKVAEIRAGDVFGELALMYSQPRGATVVCAEPAIVWQIDRITFRTVILSSNHRLREMYKAFLASVPLLSSLNDDDRGKIADALRPQDVEDGEAVVIEGDKGEAMFFIEAGEAVATKRMPKENGEVGEVEVGRHRKGDYFGELSLLHIKPRAATVRAVVRKNPAIEPKLRIAILPVGSFTRLLGSLRDIMERNARNYPGLRRD